MYELLNIQYIQNIILNKTNNLILRTYLLLIFERKLNTDI
jgi:hypothetical protein